LISNGCGAAIIFSIRQAGKRVSVDTGAFDKVSDGDGMSLREASSDPRDVEHMLQALMLYGKS
jgi:hypothetical protein